MAINWQWTAIIDQEAIHIRAKNMYSAAQKIEPSDLCVQGVNGEEGTVCRISEYDTAA